MRIPDSILQSLGLEGIPYSEGVPNFRNVSIATIFLTQEEMEHMRDPAQKKYLAISLADDLNEADEFEEDEFSNVEVIDWDVVKLIYYGDDLDEFIGAIRSGEIPQGLVGHHESVNESGLYEYQLIPLALHEACLYRGGRSKSGTKR